MDGYLAEQFGLAGRRAVVTGASRGIGRAIAAALARAGASVGVHYHTQSEAADELVGHIQAEGGTAWSAGADLTRSEQVDGLFTRAEARWDGLDILVNNAGNMAGRSALANVSDAYIEEMLRVNLHSTLYVTRRAMPLLERGQEPVICCVTSISAHTGGAGGGVIVYGTAKAGVVAMVRGLAREVAPRIRVVGISPGVIMTDIHRQHSTPESLAGVAARTPLGRIGEPEECAGAVVFLCSRAASFITGEVIEINGGLWMG